MTEKTVEAQLAEKQAALKALVSQLRHKSVAPEYPAIHAEVLRLERMAAQKRGEPYAAKWELPGIWEGMTLDCTVLGNQLKCIVFFEAKMKSSNFKILEFRQIAGYKLTDVSDETIAAHSLAGRGLAAYGAFLIENSPWIKELKQVDGNHPQFDAQRWRKIRHYMLCFKDRIFEALSAEAKLAGETDSWSNAIRIALERLTGSR